MGSFLLSRFIIPALIVFIPTAIYCQTDMKVAGYVCSFCGKYFTDQGSARSHVCSAHNVGCMQVYIPPPGPTPQELQKMKEQKDLKEASEDAVDKGNDCYQKGDWKCAITWYTEALAYNEDNDDARENLQKAKAKQNEAAAEQARREADKQMRIIREDEMKKEEEKKQLNKIEVTKEDKFKKILQDTTTRSEPLNALLQNAQTSRNAYEYGRVINQFDVSASGRYAVSQKKDTYCNIFAWDVTRAMGAELPHWIIKGKEKAPSAIDKDGNFIVSKGGADELNVNRTMEWLNKNGKDHGWKQISISEAQRIANEGHPTVALWKNPVGEHGHIAIVRPGSVGDTRGVATAQAGKLVLNATHLKKGFNDSKLVKEIQYWYHD